MRKQPFRSSTLCALFILLAFLITTASRSRQNPQTAPSTSSAVAIVQDQADAIVTTYRKIIVLMNGAAAVDPGVRERSETAGQILFQRNHTRLDALESQLTAAIADGNRAVLDEFLARVETNREYRDADKLAFRDLFDALADASATAADTKLAARIRDDVAALDQITNLYQKEIGEILGNLQTRGMVVRREAWDKYVAFLETEYTREQILKQTEAELPPVESRGAGSKRASGMDFGTGLPAKTFVLTFDDGPHPRYTDQILAILNRYGLKAVFFEVGRNLGPESTDANVKLASTAAVSTRVLAQGSTLGNHTYTVTLCSPNLMKRTTHARSTPRAPC